MKGTSQGAQAENESSSTMDNWSWATGIFHHQIVIMKTLGITTQPISNTIYKLERIDFATKYTVDELDYSEWCH